MSSQYSLFWLITFKFKRCCLLNLLNLKFSSVYPIHIQFFVPDFVRFSEKQDSCKKVAQSAHKKGGRICSIGSACR